MKRRILLIVFFVVSIVGYTLSQTNSLSQTNPKDRNTGIDTSKKIKQKIPDIRVMDVYRLADSSKGTTDLKRAGIGDIIVVKVKGLKYLLDKSKCKDDSGRALQGCHEQEIRLFIEGRMINDISPESGAPQEDKGELQFHLQRNQKNDEAWADILGAPKVGHGFTKRTVRISVGLENDYPIPTEVNKFIFNRVRKDWFIISAIGLVLYFYVLISLARRSELLRDRGIDATSIGVVGNSTLKPFSLGRFQMAFWFSLVITSFLFIWLITGAYDIITASVLGLIGISAGTSISGAVIDSNKEEELLTKTVALQEEEKELFKRIPDLEAEIALNPANKTDLQIELATKKGRIPHVTSEIARNMNLLKPKISKGFMKDILSDANGVSFHRLQMFVWTLILGLLFVYSVWSRLAMPELSATLLALQGLTSTTYLGFKIPEKSA